MRCQKKSNFGIYSFQGEITELPCGTQHTVTLPRIFGMANLSTEYSVGAILQDPPGVGSS